MQAQINTENFTDARNHGDKALKLDPHSEKGLFRRATVCLVYFWFLIFNPFSKSCIFCCFS